MSDAVPPPGSIGIPVRWMVGVVSLALLASGITGAVVGQVVPPKPAWALIGFEVVIAFAAVFGLLAAFGRVREAPALAVLCVAGTALVGSVLGYLGVDRASLGHLPLKAWLVGRLGAAAILAGCAVILALGRNRMAWRTLVKAAVFAAPLVGVAVWYKRAHLAPLNTPLPGFGDALRVGGIVLVAAVCGVCVCAVVHLAIRAFVIADAESAGS